MAAAAATGRTRAAIARDEGISRAWASHELNTADCRQMIIGLVNSQSVRIERLFGLSLTVIEEALAARHTGLFKGDVVDMGADHYARLAAVKRIVELTAAGRPPARLPDEIPAEMKTLTLQQLEEYFGKKAPIQ